MFTPKRLIFNASLAISTEFELLTPIVYIYFQQLLWYICNLTDLQAYFSCTIVHALLSPRCTMINLFVASGSGTVFQISSLSPPRVFCSSCYANNTTYSTLFLIICAQPDLYQIKINTLLKQAAPIKETNCSWSPIFGCCFNIKNLYSLMISG